ncbi:MAG: bifunctional hydroxymethylpyrimidine kinase/phosphomethylpyrimidine kinase [Candidatus Omnitrophica bacterium]|nr:bifunctional hydroxymethylpyrimidine kinase/phosphomethylpyrimidine kinase [Candidatus Omnitrophota bacterium]MBU1925857.1 bifunctional hydroxymethylpyrimidine kinase/phosphomethylpyrimidine kinase [Candidatus Omnitrophota bacterium]
MSIVVMGTVALDTLKTPHGEKKDLLGGSAAHFAMSARHFAPVNLAAVVGEDFPKKHITLLKNKKINTNSLTIEKGCTFRWKGEYKDGDLNNACTLHTELGVIITCIPRVNPKQKNIKNVFLANYDPDIQYEFLQQMHKPTFVGMDTMNLWIHTKKQSVVRLMKKVDILILNDTEARDLTSEKNLIKAAKAILSHGPKMVIIKKGEHGGIFYSKNHLFALPAYPLEEVIDPTGAGDTFAGGVMGYLTKAKKINSKTLIKALSYATILSSFNVEGFGMEKTAGLSLGKVEERMKVFREFFRF